MPAARDIDIFPTTVCTAWFYLKISSRCRSENHHYLRVGKRGTTSSAAIEGGGRGGEAPKEPKRVFLFSRKLSPREKPPFPVPCESRPPNISPAHSPARYRSSIEHRVTASPMADEADLFVGSTRSFPREVFPFLRSPR